MNIETATVISNEPVSDGSYVIWLEAPGVAGASPDPGQFLMAHCSTDGVDPMFARAFSIHRRDGSRVALLYNVVGKATRWLVARRRGDEVRMTGPLGRGLGFPEPAGNLLMIGGGVGIAPLVDAAERALASGHNVVAMMGTRTASQLLPADAWPRQVEYVTVTEDGSAGLKGFVTQHIGAYQDWASRLYACGPTPMFQALADVLRDNGRRLSPQILMEENMPCGWGMCYGCAVFTRRGVRLCCKDGPRFSLFDLF